MEEKIIKEINNKIYHVECKNKLNVYIGENDNANGYSASLYVKYNTNDNRDAKTNGISHLITHLLVSNEKFSNNSILSIFTNTRRTLYELESNTNDTSDIINLLNVIKNKKITQEELDNNINIVKKEIDEIETKNYYKCNTYFDYFVNKNVRIKANQMGTIDNLNNITINDINDVLNTYYVPSNMVLFVYGNIDVNKLINDIQELTNYEDNRIVQVNDDLKQGRHVIKIKDNNNYVPSVIIRFISDNNTGINTSILDLYISNMLDQIFNRKYIYKLKNTVLNNIQYNYICSKDKIEIDIEMNTFKISSAIHEIERSLRKIKVDEELFNNKRDNDYEDIKDYKYNNYLMNHLLLDSIINYNDIDSDYLNNIKNMNIDVLNNIINSLSYKYEYITILK